MDLIDAVRDELMDNPLLEESSEISASEARVESAAEVAKREEATAVKDVEPTEQVDQAKEQIDWESHFENYSSPTPGSGGQRLRDDDLPGYEATLTRSETLFDHLMWQLQVSDFNDQEERVAVALIVVTLMMTGTSRARPDGRSIESDTILRSPQKWITTLNMSKRFSSLSRVSTPWCWRSRPQRVFVDSSSAPKAWCDC